MSWQPANCFICHRSATYKAKHKDICEECLPMSTKNLDEWEKTAIAEMAAEVGPPLGLGEDEAVELVRFIFLGVGDSIRSQMHGNSTPF